MFKEVVKMPLQIVREDIIKMKVDAIVNTTNEEMTGYSGVDLAIHKAAGSRLDEECRKIAPLGLGMVKITKGYNLDAKYIIHTSGPVWQGGLKGESIILKSCYFEALKAAVQNGCKTVAFPLISSGAYGYPKDQVLDFAVKTIKKFLNKIELMVYLCVCDSSSYELKGGIFDEISRVLSDSVEYKSSITTDIELSETDLLRRRMFSSSFANARSAVGKSLSTYLMEVDKAFGEKLFDMIDERGMSDVDCYKRANVTKQTFSKIRSNPKEYKPSKSTALAFAVALKLNLEETQELLESAGFFLSRSNTFDKIVRYFIQKGNYDIYEINEALFNYDQSNLGGKYD